MKIPRLHIKEPAKTPWVLLFLLMGSTTLQAQKRVAELTLVYDYSAGTQKATHTIFIKGSKSRSEMTDTLFSSTTFYDASTGSAVMLKEVSGQKLLIRLTQANWKEKNAHYDGLVFKNTGETKEIAGYRCVKAVGKTKDGVTITVFYTQDIVPDNKDYEPAFKNLDGLPLEYTLEHGNVLIRYKIARINLNPVPASQFDIPTNGYREMKYEDSKRANVRG